MKTATVHLKSISPYSQGKFYEVPKLEKEQSAAYEERTWRERMHYDNSGMVYIPPMSLKNCLSEAAKYLSIQIPGKGKATYTKHIEAGVLVMTPVNLGIKKDSVPGQWLFVPADGKRGGSKRVKKCFPIIHEWEGDAEFVILDETVTQDVFENILKEAGKFIGLGVFRPRNNGFYGRFSVESVSWQ
jgi:hypothetical protein